MVLSVMMMVIIVLFVVMVMMMVMNSRCDHNSDNVIVFVITGSNYI